MARLPTVALFGRTNVGKSTLFNRLIEQRKANVSKQQHTTRDRNYATCSWSGVTFTLVDTGGYDTGKDDVFGAEIKKHTLGGLQEAELVLFVVDARAGITPQDKEIAKIVRKLDQPTMLVVNKADNERLRNASGEFHALGIDPLVAVCATSGSGSGDLLDEVVRLLGKRKKKDASTRTSDLFSPHVDALQTKGATRIAMVGQPNVGKSSLVNAIVGAERSIVSPTPHTTRDTQDTYIRYNNEDIILLDTAGLHRKSGRGGNPDAQAHRQSDKVIKFADIVLFVTDASHKLTHQDKALVGQIVEAGSGLIYVINKWDLVEKKHTNTINEFIDYYTKEIPFIDWVPFIFVSATEKQRTNKLIELCLEIQKERAKHIDDEELEKFIEEIQLKHLPSKGKGVKHPKIVGFTQVSSIPPTFVLKVIYRRSLHDSYVRFIERQLRAKWGFMGSPIKIHVQGVKG